MLVGLIAEACGIPMANVPYIAYSGGGAASAALLGGQVTAGVTGYSEWRGLAQERRLRILAAASAERFGDRQIPDAQGSRIWTCCSINGAASSHRRG